MIRKNQRFLNAVNAVTDGLLVFCAYLLASFLWLDVFKNSNNMASVDNFKQGLGAAALVYAVAMMLILASLRMYNPGRVRRIRYEAAVVIEANLLGVLGIGAVLYLFRLQEFSRGVLGLFFIISSLLLSVKHVSLRIILNHMRARGFNLKHIAVVGTGNLARQYAYDVQEIKRMGLRINGFFGDDPGDKLEKYVGPFDMLDAHLQGVEIDEVIVALEPNETQFVRKIISICEKNGTKVSVIPFYNDIIPSNPTIEIIGKSKLINLRSNPLDNLGFAIIKRGIDVAGSAVALFMLSPLMLVAAIGTKLSSKGPAFFCQQRMGRGKKIFRMYKFRSMKVNVDQDTAWSTNEDPRKTRFGSFLRKFSIDELPQLFNVFKGDMSLVGPRPEIPHYVEQFKEEIPLYMVKHQVRPGMTGWAQVNGYRGNTSIIKRIEHDIWYIENWTLELDIKILFMTAFGGWVNKEKLKANDDKTSGFST